MKTVEERFWEKVIVKKPNDCWEWVASKNDAGYGMFRFRGSMQLAHRVSYILVFGEIPIGLLVCHECDNTSCTNPNHLFLGTGKDNIQDCVKKKRNWPNTHPHKQDGSRNPYAKLNDEDVLKIRETYETMNCSYRELSTRFGIGVMQICRIINRKQWRSIT